MCLFLSTLSLRRATLPRNADCNYRSISIHALLAESDAKPWRKYHTADISIHALLAESDALAPKQNATQQRISIHALLAESDALIRYLINTYHNFYPRSPCGERLISIALSTQPTRFLSTLSLRRATSALWMVVNLPLFLSTLSLRRATSWRLAMILLCLYFYPRSPCGERLIHEANQASQGVYFYPRSPCGERLYKGYLVSFEPEFLSTLSLRRATQALHVAGAVGVISIHALLAESDPDSADRLV